MSCILYIDNENYQYFHYIYIVKKLNDKQKELHKKGTTEFVGPRTLKKCSKLCRFCLNCRFFVLASTQAVAITQKKNGWKCVYIVG